MPEVRALNVGKQLEVRQPRNAPFFKLPRNEVMLTVSGGGKTNAHIQTLTNRDKLGGLFDKYVVMSPNCQKGGDPNYDVLAAYIEQTTGQKRDECFHSEWDPQIILDTMAEMRKINGYIRKHKERLGATRLMSCHITIDDWADRADVSKSNNSPLIKLFLMGRHSQCSTTILTQKFRNLNSGLRINANSLWIGRVTSSLEAKALSEEFGAAAGSEKNFLDMLKRATTPDFGFLYVVFGTRVRFFNSYKGEFVVKDDDEDRDEE
jgi:hypothetical protein